MVKKSKENVVEKIKDACNNCHYFVQPENSKGEKYDSCCMQQKTCKTKSMKDCPFFIYEESVEV